MLVGKRAEYTVTGVSTDGTSVTLNGRGSTQVMRDIEFVRFDDGVVSISSFRK